MNTHVIFLGNEKRALNRTLRAASCISAVLLVALVLTAVTSGASLEMLQRVRPFAESAPLLLAHAYSFQISCAINTLFACGYLLTFLLLAQIGTEPRFRSVATLGAVILTLAAILDILKTMHVLGLVEAARSGVDLAGEAGLLQKIAGLFKWMLASLGILLIGVALRATSPLAALLSRAMVFGLLPLGVLIFASTGTTALALGITRTVLMLAGLLLIAYIDWDEMDPHAV